MDVARALSIMSLNVGDVVSHKGDQWKVTEFSDRNEVCCEEVKNPNNVKWFDPFRDRNINLKKVKKVEESP